MHTGLSGETWEKETTCKIQVLMGGLY